MPPEITVEEYDKITFRLVKLLRLYKNNEITEAQILSRIFDCFFTTK